MHGVLATEHCLYTMTKDHGFLVQARSDDPRIVAVAACSGHAFKFGPVVGQLAAAAVLDTLERP